MKSQAFVEHIWWASCMCFNVDIYCLYEHPNMLSQKCVN